MIQKQKTAAKAAPRVVELPASKAAYSAASMAQTAPANGADTNTDARLREAAAAAGAGIAAQPQERAMVSTAKAVVKAASAPRAAAGDRVAGYEDMAAVGQENLEACIKCGSIVINGMEMLGKQVVSFAQAAVEANLTAARNILTAQTWYEAIELQTDFARDRFESVAAETAKLGEISLQVANQALEPIQSRIGASAEKLFQPLAL